MKKNILYLFILSLLGVVSCTEKPQQESGPVNAAVFAAYVNGERMTTSKAVEGVSIDDVVFDLEFSTEIDIDKFDPSLIVFSGGPLEVSLGGNEKTLRLEPVNALKPFTSYTLNVLALEQLGVSVVEPYRYTIVTALDTSDKFERISDEELLTLIQDVL